MAQLQWICLQCRRPRFDRWVGKIPWRKERLPTPVFWPGEFHWLYSPWGCKESDTTEWLSLSLLYNIVMVFAIHQHELTIGIHVSPPSWTPLPFANIFKTKGFHTHTHTRTHTTGLILYPELSSGFLWGEELRDLPQSSLFMYFTLSNLLCSSGWFMHIFKFATRAIKMQTRAFSGAPSADGPDLIPGWLTRSRMPQLRPRAAKYMNQ